MTCERAWAQVVWDTASDLWSFLNIYNCKIERTKQIINYQINVIYISNFLFVRLPPELNFSMSNFYEIDLKSRHVFFRLFFCCEGMNSIAFLLTQFHSPDFLFHFFLVDENLFYSFFSLPLPPSWVWIYLFFSDLLVTFRLWRSHVREGEKEKRERERESALAGVKKLSKSKKKHPRVS